MQHHHSRVSRSLQPAIDSLPSISDLSLNLISFSPPPPKSNGCVCACVSACPVYAPVIVCLQCGLYLLDWEVSPRLTLVNGVTNQGFIIINVILCHPVVYHTLSGPIYVESQQRKRQRLLCPRDG